jgi:hypothetical protein
MKALPKKDTSLLGGGKSMLHIHPSVFHVISKASIARQDRASSTTIFEKNSRE